MRFCTVCGRTNFLRCVGLRTLRSSSGPRQWSGICLPTRQADDTSAVRWQSVSTISAAISMSTSLRLYFDVCEPVNPGFGR